MLECLHGVGIGVLSLSTSAVRLRACGLPEVNADTCPASQGPRGMPASASYSPGHYDPSPSPPKSQSQGSQDCPEITAFVRSARGITMWRKARSLEPDGWCSNPSSIAPHCVARQAAKRESGSERCRPSFCLHVCMHFKDKTL